MSDFYATKIKAMFSFMDLNKDGIVSLKDFEAFADLFQDHQKVDLTMKELAKSFFLEVFRMYKSSAGSDDSGVLTAQIMTDSLKQLRNNPKFIELYTNTVLGFFRVMDLNEDGFIQPEEFTRIYTTVGIRDLSFVKPSFDSIDLNHDGKISRGECIDAFVEYITSEDEKSPYKLLYGYPA